MPQPAKKPVISFLSGNPNIPEIPEITDLRGRANLGRMLAAHGVERCFIFQNPVDNGIQKGLEPKVRISFLCRSGRDPDSVADDLGFYFHDQGLNIAIDAIGREHAGLDGARSQSIITQQQYDSAVREVGTHFRRTLEPAGAHR